jgi:GT2 family glycosyltransferase
MIHKKLVIVLVNYHGFKDTKACVESIRLRSEKHSFIIIVDNSEPSDTSLVEILDDSMHLIQTGENLGFGKANNIGINWAREHIHFDSLLLLNNDTLITAGSLQTMQACLKEQNAGIVTCKTMFADDPTLVWYGGGEIDYQKGWPKIVEFNQQASPEGANKSRYVTFVSGCVILFSRKAIEELEGFDEIFFMYAEDLELSIRAAKKNIKIWYTADAIIYHKVQGSFGDKNKYKGMHSKNLALDFHFYHKKRNQWVTFRKHLQGKAFRKFRRNYWFSFFKTLFRILLRSPQRFKVLRAAFKVMRSLSYKEA